jgi:hypothetical protein
MFTEKEIEKINKFLSNQTFECSSTLIGGRDMPYFNFNFEYQFAITGIKQMISVGEWYDNVKVYVEIIDIEDKFKKFYGILGKHYNKEELTNIFFKKEYVFTHRLNECISDTLKYFTSDEFVRIYFDNIIMSDNLYETIKNTEDTA